MSTRKLLLGLTIVLTGVGLLAPPEAEASRRRRVQTHENKGHLTFASPQANPIALQPAGQTCSATPPLLLVANTTSGTVDVIDTATNTVTASVEVGMEPVSVAFRPDGCEAWVANHVSDSVSVIDTSFGTGFLVVETIQDLDANGATLFDEPVGIAFADNTKAYVALSSRNQVAIVDATTYSVSGHLVISAQDPRAIAVRNGRLFVTAFESHNQTQSSFCDILGNGNGIVGDPCSMGLIELGQFVTSPNLPGATKNIVVDTNLPDRDLFVYRTDTDAFLEAVPNVGTLLYGLAVDSNGNVFVTQAEARNDANGDHGEFLDDLDNRMFLNQITELDCGGSNNNPCNTPTRHDLEPLPPAQPTAGNELATPYGVAVSADDNTLLVTAAGTSRLFSVAASSPGVTLDILDLDDPGVGGDEGQQIPRGVVLDSGTGTAYVLNTLDNSVTVVSVDLNTGSGSYGELTHVTEIPVGSDPTSDDVRLGRIAFNNAFASDSGTFSCASCHPDGNTDQLLWRIGGACPGLSCQPGDEPRTTMPVRGLRDTLPLHWDGTLGDPFGGTNGSGGSGSNCNLADPPSLATNCFRQLVDESLSGVMCDQGGSCTANQITAGEKEDMAIFLESVSYPPARSRRMDDSVSSTVLVAGDEVFVTDPQGGNAIEAGALEGFQDFMMDVGGAVNQPDTCADSDAGCHELPLLAGTNSETLTGFDAPTMRGMTDRFVQFSLGPTSAEPIMGRANAGLNVGIPTLTSIPLEAPIQWDANDGFREITTFGTAFLAFEGVYGPRPLDTFQMFEEMSTGHSGALGRQVTLNTVSTGGCTSPPGLACTGSCPVENLLLELEAADQRKVVNLRGSGLYNGIPRNISYLEATQQYQVGPFKLRCGDLINQAQGPSPLLVGTLTAHLRNSVSESAPQPLIAPEGAQCGTGTGLTGDPALPPTGSFNLETAHVSAGDEIFLNGQPTGLSVSSVTVGGATTCNQPDDGLVTPDLIAISGLARAGVTELLQIRSVSSGLLSNEIPLP